MNNLHLAVQFFIQLAVILLLCRLVDAIALRLGQPQVVAEMVAGVLLGPSLFGLLWPEAQHWLSRGTPLRKCARPKVICFRLRNYGLRFTCLWSE
jgi:hypothetical protein